LSGTVGLPTAAIIFGSVTPPQGDVVTCKINLGCTKQVSSFEVLLQNWNGKYSPNGSYPITVGMTGSISLGRGATCPLVITLRVEVVQYEETAVQYYVRVSGRCWGEKLFRMVVTKDYINQKGEAIVQDLVANYAGLNYSRTVLLTQNAAYGQPYVYIAPGDTAKFSIDQTVTLADSQNSESNTINAIGINIYNQGWLRMNNPLAHTYTVANGANVNYQTIMATSDTFDFLEYKNSPVWDVLTYLAGACDLNGAIGFDFRVAPDGVFEWFPIGSKASPLGSLSGVIESCPDYTHAAKKDISRVRNLITVYGSNGDMNPTNGDACESLTGWTDVTPGSLYLDSSMPKVGSYDVWCYANPTSGDSDFYYSLAASAIIEDGEDLVFWGRSYAAQWNTQQIRIKAPDASNYFLYSLPGSGLSSTSWTLYTLPCGESQEYDANNNPSGIWTKVGSPSWLNVTAVEFYFIGPTGVSIAVCVDGLHFDSVPYQATEQDANSQSAWGVRQLTETDESLSSDAACDMRAKALLNYYSSPDVYIKLASTVIDYGWTPLLPGDMINVVLPNENVNASYRIDTVEYYVDNSSGGEAMALQITVELGVVPPQLADYLYGIRTRGVKPEKLSRIKVGKQRVTK
jgi:hypothetical protein